LSHRGRGGFFAARWRANLERSRSGGDFL